MAKQTNAAHELVENIYSLLESLPSKTFVCDIKGRIIYISPSLMEDMSDSAPRNFTDLFESVLWDSFVKSFSFVEPLSLAVFWDGKKYTLSMSPYNGYMMFRMVYINNSALPTADQGLLTLSEMENRNSLSIILASIEYLKRSIPEEDTSGREYLAQIKQNVFKMKRVSENLIDCAGYDMGFLKIYREVGDYSSFVKSIVKRLDPVFEKLNIEFVTDITPNPIFTVFDKQKTERMILNSLAAAVKSKSPCEKVFLGLCEDGDSITVRIEYFGKKKQHFSYEGPKSTICPTEEGCGVPIASSIASLHGGSLIQRDGEGGEGEIYISIPIGVTGEDFGLKSPDFSGGVDPILLEFSQILDSSYYK